MRASFRFVLPESCLFRHRMRMGWIKLGGGGLKNLRGERLEEGRPPPTAEVSIQIRAVASFYGLHVSGEVGRKLTWPTDAVASE